MAQKKRSSPGVAAPAALSLVSSASSSQSVMGARVQQLRAQRGLSRAALAAQVGTDESGLAAVECGQVDPSIDLTWSLATALGLPFSALVQGPAAPAPKPRSLLSRRALFPSRHDGGSHRGTEVHELKLAPHGAERAPLHPHGSRETLLVTAGRVIVQSAAEQRVLGPGDTCMIAGDAERYYVNPDATDAVMYAMVAPERGPAPLSRCARRR